MSLFKRKQKTAVINGNPAPTIKINLNNNISNIKRIDGFKHLLVCHEPVVICRSCGVIQAIEKELI